MRRCAWFLANPEGGRKLCKSYLTALVPFFVNKTQEGGHYQHQIGQGKSFSGQDRR